MGRQSKKRAKATRESDRRQNRMLYYAYGSNLHIEQMKRRCPDAKEVGPAVLSGYKLVFRGVADIVEAEKGKVQGAVWSITPNDLKALDRYEGFPSLYLRFYVTVEVKDRGPAKALVYQMTDSASLGLPSPNYLGTCLKGLSAWGLPSWQMKRAVKEAARWHVNHGETELVEYGKRMLSREEVDARRAAAKAVKIRSYTDIPSWTSGGDALRDRSEMDRRDREWYRQTREEANAMEWPKVPRMDRMSPATRAFYELDADTEDEIEAAAGYVIEPLFDTRPLKGTRL